ncbi:MAG: hypothetical protein QXU45_03290 [Candidatus Bathyarchaeia archaeon]
MARITGGEVLKRCLVQEGVRYVFGVPGLPFRCSLPNGRGSGLGNFASK